MSKPIPESEQPKAVLEERELQLLGSYPDQEFYFPDDAGANVDALAADILANGLQQPIEIIPNGTVISGHRRRKAMTRLLLQGHEEFRFVEVVVRYDLAAEGPEAIKRRFLEENLNRRHLTPMAFAAVSWGLYELGIGTGQSDAKLKQQIAQQYRVSTKTLERWWALRGLPIELQSLIERKLLSQRLGQQLLDCAKPEEMQELVELARSGMPEDVKRRAKEIVKPRINDKPPKQRPPEEVFQAFLRISGEMLTDYEAVAELVRRDLCDRKQMLLYLRRLRQIELAARQLLSIVETSDRLESDELEYQPSLRRVSIEESMAAIRALASDFGLAAQPAAKQSLPPLKLKPAKTVKPLKLTPTKKLPLLKLRKPSPAA